MVLLLEMTASTLLAFTATLSNGWFLGVGSTVPPITLSCLQAIFKCAQVLWYEKALQVHCSVSAEE